jgi:prepilin-type N-terminal cleavage/methylation domain-containing protein
MTTSTKRLQKGFTLIELLTVIAIIGILAAIIIPTVGKVRDTAAKSVAASNLRQIGQAALIYASDNKDALPKWTNVTSGTSFGTANATAIETVDSFAAALAVGGGLNDATIWVVSNDKNGTTTTGASTVYTPTAASKAFTGGTPSFNDLSLAFGVVIGLTTSDSSTTPIAYTRGISASTTGSWSDTLGVYGSDGGHVVFLGGNVQYYRNLGTQATTSGELINSDGNKTNKITDTVKSTRTTVKFIEEVPAGSSSTATAATGK